MKTNKIGLIILPFIFVDLVLIGISIFSKPDLLPLIINIFMLDVIFVMIIYIQVKLPSDAKKNYLNYPIYYVSALLGIISSILSAIFIVFKSEMPYVIIMFGIILVGFLILYNLVVIANSKKTIK